MSLRRYTVSVDDQTFTVDVVETAVDRFEVAVDGRVFTATLVGAHDLPRGAISPAVPEPAAAPPARPAPPAPPAPAAGASARQPAPPARRPPSGGEPSTGLLTAPLPGVVLELFVAPGAILHRGDPVLVLEAMKMRNTIRSRSDALVVEVAVAEGQPVGPGDILVRLDSLPT